MISSLRSSSHESTVHSSFAYIQGHQSGLKRGGAQRGRAGNFGVYLAPKYELCKLCPELSGRGRKSGGARALLALPRMAPLSISKNRDGY